MLKQYPLALSLVKRMATVYDDGPGGQAHQVFEQHGRALQRPLKAAADQQYNELSADKE